MTAVEADPTGEVPIEVVERGSSGMGEVNARGFQTSDIINKTTCELLRPREI